MTSTQYFDRDGNLRVTQEHWAITDGLLYNSVHPEIALPEGPDHVLWKIDPDTGVLDLSGLALHLTVPGYGVVAIDAGERFSIRIGPSSGSGDRICSLRARLIRCRVLRCRLTGMAA